jgi:hypothetical protein
MTRSRCCPPHAAPRARSRLVARLRGCGALPSRRRAHPRRRRCQQPRWGLVHLRARSGAAAGWRQRARLGSSRFDLVNEGRHALDRAVPANSHDVQSVPRCLLEPAAGRREGGAATRQRASPPRVRRAPRAARTSRTRSTGRAAPIWRGLGAARRRARRDRSKYAGGGGGPTWAAAGPGGAIGWRRYVAAGCCNQGRAAPGTNAAWRCVTVRVYIAAAVASAPARMPRQSSCNRRTVDELTTALRIRRMTSPW